MPDTDDNGANEYARSRGFMPATPDPTVLTTDAVNQAVNTARRDIVALQETLETRLNGSDEDRQRLWDRVQALPGLYETSTNHLRDELIQRDAHTREVITQRLNDLDTAAKLAAERIERIPADNAADAKALAEDFKESIRTEHEYFMAQIKTLEEIHAARISEIYEAIKWRDGVAERIRDEINEKIGHLREIHITDLTHVQQQFNERDKRFDREASNAQTAITTALTGARELVTLQTAADAIAAQKTEQGFTKQIDALAARVDDLKERIAESGGRDTGAKSERTEHRLGQGAVVSLVIAGISLLGLIITVVSLVASHKL